MECTNVLAIYDELNAIHHYHQRADLPFNILKTNINPTYKEINLKYVSGKKYFVKVRKKSKFNSRQKNNSRQQNSSQRSPRDHQKNNSRQKPQRHQQNNSRQKSPRDHQKQQRHQKNNNHQKKWVKNRHFRRRRRGGADSDDSDAISDWEVDELESAFGGYDGPILVYM